MIIIVYQLTVIIVIMRENLVVVPVAPLVGNLHQDPITTIIIIIIIVDIGYIIMTIIVAHIHAKIVPILMCLMHQLTRATNPVQIKKFERSLYSGHAVAHQRLKLFNTSLRISTDHREEFHAAHHPTIATTPIPPVFTGPDHHSVGMALSNQDQLPCAGKDHHITDSPPTHRFRYVS